MLPLGARDEPTSIWVHADMLRAGDVADIHVGDRLRADVCDAPAEPTRWLGGLRSVPVDLEAAATDSCVHVDGVVETIEVVRSGATHRAQPSAFVAATSTRAALAVLDGSAIVTLAPGATVRSAGHRLDDDPRTAARSCTDVSARRTAGA